MMMSIRNAIVIAVVLLTSIPALAQTKHRDESAGYTFLPPEGWVKLDPIFVKSLNEALDTAAPNRRERFTDAWAKGIGPTGITYPCLIISRNNTRLEGHSWKSIGKQLGSDEFFAPYNDPENTGLDSLQVAFESPSLDRKNARVILPSSEHDPTHGTLKTLSFINLGKKSQIQLNFMATEAEYAEYLPTFMASADSFKRYKSQQFVPKSAISFNFRPYLIATGIGLVVVFLTRFAKKKPVAPNAA